MTSTVTVKGPGLTDLELQAPFGSIAQCRATFYDDFKTDVDVFAKPKRKKGKSVKTDINDQDISQASSEETGRKEEV